jgi:hypothetical protein
MHDSPKSTVALTPMRAAISPPGSAPTSVPAAYAPASTPADVFDSPSVSR